MPGTFFGIQSAATGLAAAQIGQDVTGHNIANAGTPGYSVQSANFQAAIPLTTPDQFSDGQLGTIGSGVVVGSITRSRDQYLDQQVWDATGQKSNQSAQSTALSQIENAFGEPSDTGINASLGNFFQSFTNLVNNPEDTGVRATVVQAGGTLAQVFQQTQSALTAQGQQLTLQQSDDMASLNSYGQQIAKMNQTIRASQAQGLNANDLMDQRGALIDKISNLANVTATNNTDGTVSVSIGSSQLVFGTDSFSLSLTGPDSLTARGDLTSGELAGLGAAQADLTGYQTDLNNVAASVISAVNTVHQNGAGLDGTTGLDFFTGTDANSIAVNPDLISDPSKIAAAAIPPSGGAPPAGDASNATAIAAVENTKFMSGPLTGQTLQGFYQQRITNLGAQTASANTALGSATANASQLSSQRDSISGVSTDTEMVNMMKYQQSYAASARVVQTMNSMLDTLINGLFS